MSIAGKIFTLVVAIFFLAAHPCSAEVARADRVELAVPDGGITLLRPPASTSTFKHRLFDVTIEVQVEARPYFDVWKRGCASGNADTHGLAYQSGCASANR